MNNELQISDFFGYYPKITDPDFNSYISAKTEFSELKSVSVERQPKRGESYPHQKFVTRYLLQYDRLLITDEPGTGKSCIIVHSAEMFKREFQKHPSDPTKISRAVILISGETGKANIEAQIVNNCTEGVYQDKLKMFNPKLEKIKSWYTILTYQNFYNEFKGRSKSDKIKYMSNKVFYVDEAHNMITSSISKSDRDLGDVNEPRDTQIEMNKYKTYKEAFSVGLRNKIVLLTATPAINNVVEYSQLLNLILPKDQQMPEWTTMDWYDGTVTFKKFEPYVRGRVVFNRALETGAIAEFQGDPLPADNIVTGEPLETIVYSVYMGEYQYQAYQNQPNKNDTIEGFSIDLRKISNFVFPDGTVAPETFTKYIKEKSGWYQLRSTNELGELSLDDVFTTEADYDSERSILQYSPKFYFAYEICRDACLANFGQTEEELKESFPETPEYEIYDRFGVVFIYSDFVKYGVVLFALFLEKYGFDNGVYTRFEPPKPVSTGRLGEKVNEYQDINKMSKAKRYVILTAGLTKFQIQNIFDIVNHEKNKNGEYIQVVLGSRVAGEGISIYNAVSMVMLQPTWNESKAIQARNRVFRSTSHTSKLNEKRRLIEKYNETHSPVSTENLKIPVKMYNMASIFPDNPELSESEAESEGAEESEAESEPEEEETDTESEPEERYRTVDGERVLTPSYARTALENVGIKNQSENPIEISLYILAEEKQTSIQKGMNYLKRSSVNCFTALERNTRQRFETENEKIRQGSDCCSGIVPEIVAKPDNSTKILFYAKEEMVRVTKKISEMFATRYVIKIEELSRELKINPMYVTITLSQILRDSVQVTDRLGYKRYIKENASGDLYLAGSLDSSVPVFPGIVIRQNRLYNNFKDYSKEQIHNREEYQQFITEYNRAADLGDTALLTDLKEKGAQLLAEMSPENKAKLAEDIIYRLFINKDTSPFNRFFLDIFSFSIYYLSEIPVDKINWVSVELRKTKPGMPAKGIRKVSVTGLDENTLIPVVTENLKTKGGIVIHKLLQTSDRKNPQYIRILNIPSDNTVAKWKTASVEENIVYQEHIRLFNKKITEYYKQFPMRGFEGRNGFTVILSKLNTGGKACSSYKINELIYALVRLENDVYDKPTDNYSYLPDDEFAEQYKTQIQDFIKRKERNKLKNNDLCRMLKDELLRRGWFDTGEFPATLLQEIQEKMNR